jgi:hypothetical protein
MNRRGRAALIAAGLLAAACGPRAPQGVEEAALDEAVGRAIGDPYTCVLIGEIPSGRIVYRFGTHAVCGRELPACDRPALQTVQDLMRGIAETKTVAVTRSCASDAAGARSVAWAAGTLRGGALAYAAAMEGETAPPGLVVAEKLKGAFARVGLQAD